ncbi:MAG: AAA family ATPase [Myxococcales bacterium]|nr:AAA family ATPase [Myxococcales bacterium]
MTKATTLPPDDIKPKVDAFITDVTAFRNEIGKVIVGQADIIDGVIMALLGGGHVLLEGVPGLGKTLLVRTLASAMDASFSRIQFTPDLMPADIVGTQVLVDDGNARRFEFQRGPLFANIVLADEINRATPKTQSALLEAMSEGSVTVAKTTHRLERPFFVLATQNPLEMEGTYPLPEAQLDRFLVKLIVDFPSRSDLNSIVERTTSDQAAVARPVLSKTRVGEMQELVRKVPMAKNVQDYAVGLLESTHPSSPGVPAMVKKYIRYGASPRGLQAMVLAAKTRALLQGRYAVATDDIRHVSAAALRHRMLLSFEGQAEGIAPDAVIAAVIAHLGDAK